LDLLDHLGNGGAIRRTQVIFLVLTLERDEEHDPVVREQGVADPKRPAIAVVWAFGRMEPPPKKWYA
jgi:hypothetical protein